MREGAFSRTAIAACALREIHRRIDRPQIFDDPIAASFARRRLSLLQVPNWVHALDQHGLSVMHCARGHIVARSAYAEEQLQHCVADGAVARYVLLGAGLDSFAWRRPDWARSLPVIEVDHPATQAEKQRRAESLDDPGDIQFLGVDFCADVLSEKLQHISGVASSPSFVSWLGVTAYLPPATVMATLRELQQALSPGSRLVMDFVGGYRGRAWFRPEVLGAGVMAAWVAARGEPFRYRGQSLKSQRAAWKDAGWDIAELLTEPEVNRRFFTRAQSPLRTIPGTGLVHLVRA